MPWIISRCYIWYMQTWRSDILRHCFNTCDSLPYNFRDKSSCYQPPTVQHDGGEEQCLTEVSHLSLDGGNDHAFFHTLVHATPLVCLRPSEPHPRGQTPLRVKYLGLSISLELKKTLGWEGKCVQGSKKVILLSFKHSTLPWPGWLRNYDLYIQSCKSLESVLISPYYGLMKWRRSCLRSYSWGLELTRKLI